LGGLTLDMRIDKDNRVHLRFTAESDQARDLLTRHLPQLREALAKQNLGFGEMSVDVGDRDAQQQQTAAQMEDQSRFGRSRRGRQDGRSGGRSDPTVAAPVRPMGTRTGGASGLNIVV
jgi:flagellar hook-length control protein FliK